MDVSGLISFLTSPEGIASTLGATAAAYLIDWMGSEGSSVNLGPGSASPGPVDAVGRHSAERKCTLATYELSSTTQNELRKLRASPAYQKWHQEQLPALNARRELESRKATWIRVFLFVLQLYAIFLLPAGSFTDAQSPSVSSCLSSVGNDVVKIVAALGLAVLLLATFVGTGANGATASVIGLCTVALLTEGVAEPGAGFALLLLSVGVNCFFF